MKSISETEYMSAAAQKVLLLASKAVAAVPDGADPDRIRCHELARAVAETLEKSGKISASLEVVDGKYGSVEHSWVHLSIDLRERYILDVYAVGRLPQVQLLELHPLLEEVRALNTWGLPRGDVRKDVVQRMVKAMRAAPGLRSGRRARR